MALIVFVVFLIRRQRRQNTYNEPPATLFRDDENDQNHTSMPMKPLVPAELPAVLHTETPAELDGSNRRTQEEPAELSP